MSDAWRLRFTFYDPPPARRTGLELLGPEIGAQIRQGFGARVAVSVTDRHVYLCTGTRDSAVAAVAVIRAVLAAHHLRATYAIHSWDPSINRWINSANSVPDDTGLRLKRDKLSRGPASEIDRDTRMANSTGFATWQVRVGLSSHRDAVAFAERLKAQGHPPLRRWRHLLVGARNQDEAHALADAIHAQAPPWAVISVLRVPPWILPAALGSIAD